MYKTEKQKKDAQVHTLPYKIKEMDCVVATMTPETVEPAIKLMAKTWVGGEPLSGWLKASETELIDYFNEMQRKRAGPEPWLSICIIDPKGTILGHSLAMELKAFPASTEDPTDQLMAALYVKYEAKVGRRAGRGVELSAMGLDDVAKGSGMARHLLLGPLVAAAAQGYEWCVGQTSHDLSAKVVESIGMKWVTSIKYDEFLYKGTDGTEKPIFKGIDAWFTARINKTRPKEKQLTTSASQFSIYEGNIKEILEANHF